jgi:hypothetical protein
VSAKEFDRSMDEVMLAHIVSLLVKLTFNGL